MSSSVWLNFRRERSGLQTRKSSQPRRLCTPCWQLPIFARARKAAQAHRCRRETPIAWRHGDTLIEGVIDLAFEDGTRWTLVDFKTDEEFRSAAPYQRQLGLYALAVEQACSTPVEAFLVKI